MKKQKNFVIIGLAVIIALGAVVFGKKFFPLNDGVDSEAVVTNSITSVFEEKASAVSELIDTTDDKTERTEEKIVAESFTTQVPGSLENSALAKAQNYQIFFVNGMDPLEYNGHAYAIIDFKDIPGLNKENPSFEEWEAFAEDMGGYLAVIDDAAENNFIYYQVLGSQGFTGAFFGYTDRMNENDWHWVNGSTSTYTNWNQQVDEAQQIFAQPNNGASSPKHEPENYAQFYRLTADGTWNDACPGENTHKFVVEWE